MRRLLIAIAVAAGISSCGSGHQPAKLDIQAARACETYFEFYNGPPITNPGALARMPPPLRKQYNDAIAKIHTPTGQEVRDAARPLMQSSRWSDLGAKLASAADAGDTGRAPQDEALLTTINHGCNSIPRAAKKAGGWKPDALAD